MQTLNLAQGSPEWLAHRRTSFNASDAPAMMGCSPYKTRSALLHELHTGISPEHDAATERRFADGHRFEALARPLGEQVIGEDLSPLSGSIDAGLSRGLAGVSGSTLVVNVAGSRYAVRDGMATLNPLAVHIIGQLSSLEI